LKVISPLGIAASLKAMEELRCGEAAQRAALSSKLEQLEYEAKRAFEQYDVVDARNRLAAAELERRWNEKLEEIDTVRQQLACFAENAGHLLQRRKPGFFRWVRTSLKCGRAITAYQR
jgi:hypothetical protein